MTINEYTEGDVVDCYTSTPFQNEAGAATDPTTVTVKYTVTAPGAVTPGAATVLTYTGAATQAVGVVARLSTGDYSTWLDTTGKPGLWTWEIIGTGAAQATQSGQFQVNAPPI